MSAKASDGDLDARNRALRHPAYFFVFVPIVASVDAALRFNRGRHHPSVLAWVLPAAIAFVLALVFGLVLVLVRRARRANRSGRRSASIVTS